MIRQFITQLLRKHPPPCPSVHQMTLFGLSNVHQAISEEVILFGCNSGMVRTWFVRTSKAFDVCRHEKASITYLSGIRINGKITHFLLLFIYHSF